MRFFIAAIFSLCGVLSLAGYSASPHKELPGFFMQEKIAQDIPKGLGDRYSIYATMADSTISFEGLFNSPQAMCR